MCRCNMPCRMPNAEKRTDPSEHSALYSGRCRFPFHERIRNTVCKHSGIRQGGTQRYKIRQCLYVQRKVGALACRNNYRAELMATGRRMQPLAVFPRKVQVLSRNDGRTRILRGYHRKRMVARCGKGFFGKHKGAYRNQMEPNQAQSPYKRDFKHRLCRQLQGLP